MTTGANDRAHGRKLTQQAPARAFALAAILTVAFFAAAMAWGEGSASAGLTGQQRGYLRLAVDGVRKARQQWWDADRAWYKERLGGGRRPRPVTLWSSVHLFEALDAIAIAAPNAATKLAVRDFALGAERYWNPDLPGGGGFGSLPGERGPRRRAWFDDNGWWGLAFLDAYRATGQRRWLRDAKGAYGFIARAGWDATGSGGIWWSTRREFKAGESLATATLLAARLYLSTRDQRYLLDAERNVEWGRTHTWNVDSSLFGRHETDDTPMPYVQAPMAAADVRLGHTTWSQSLVDRGQELAAASINRFQRLDMGPQFDSMYVRWMLYLYSMDGNPSWYRLAASEAEQARAKAGDGRGRWLRTWDGARLTNQADSRMLQPHAATTMLFAWLAATPPPPP